MKDKTPNDIRAIIDAIRRSREFPAYERRTGVTNEIIQDLKGRGSFFNTTRGFFYFENSETPKLYPIEMGSISLSSMIATRYDINKAEREYEHVLNGLCNESYERGRSVEVHSLAHYDRESGRLYVSRFNGTVYRLNGRTILEVPNGTDGVFFWDDPNWQSYEVFRGKPRTKLRSKSLNSMIFDSTNFSDASQLSADDQRWLFSVWLRSHFFGSLLPTKPLLLTCGEKGSGKTLALRKWLKFLFGAAGEVTSIERDKPDGFVAAVSSKPIVVFDNVDEHVGWLADQLAQLATGIAFSRRQLYTTNEQVEFKPQCFVALTSRTPKFIDGRDDVLDRTLILGAERFTAFSSEDSLLEEIAKHRNSLWTELLRDLNRLLSVTPNADCFRVFKTSSRMADFAGFAMAIARAEGDDNKATRILSFLEERRNDLLLADEPIFLCLEKWLENPENRGRAISSAELQRELASIAKENGGTWPYTSGRSLGQRLAHITGNLSQHFRVDITKDSAKMSQYRFQSKAGTVNQTNSRAA
jgi:hypothetical protein